MTGDGRGVRPRPRSWTRIRKLTLLSLPALGCVLILLEGVCRWVIPASERPDPAFDHTELIPKYQPGAGTYTIGPWATQRGRWRINNDGWNNDLEYRELRAESRIAVIGDSFVEAFQVDVNQTFFSILDRHMGPSTRVLSFGRAGAPLSHYLHVSRYVIDHFDPQTLVVVVIHNDFDLSINRLNPWDNHFMTLDLSQSGVREIQPTARELGSIRRALKKSALVRYVFYNLRLSAVISSLKARAATRGVPVAFEDRVYDNLESVDRVIHHVVGSIRDEIQDRRVIFVMDAPRQEIYSRRLDGARSLVLHRMMLEATQRFGCEFLDLTGPMGEDFARHGRPFNTQLDLHWNEYGHALVAQQLLALLDHPPRDVPGENDAY